MNQTLHYTLSISFTTVVTNYTQHTKSAFTSMYLLISIPSPWDFVAPSPARAGARTDFYYCITWLETLITVTSQVAYKLIA